MKKYISILILAILIFPSISLAAWWNPSTWFGSNSTVDQQPIQQTVNPENQVVNDQQQSSTTEPLLSVIISSSAMSTTSVQTSDLAAKDESQLKAQINSLTAQNSLLKSKLTTAANQLATTQNSYSMCQANLASLQNTKAQSSQTQSAIVPAVPAAKPATITFFVNDPRMPPTSPKPVTVSTLGTGQYLGLPILNLYVSPSSDGFYLRTLSLNVSNSGQGTANTAYLYQGNVSSSLTGSKPIATSVIANGVATFDISPSSPLQIPLNTYESNPLTIMVDVSGLEKNGDSEVIAASAGTMTADNSAGQSISANGTGSGNVITVTN